MPGISGTAIVETSFGSQGRTVHRVILGMSSLVDAGDEHGTALRVGQRGRRNGFGSIPTTRREIRDAVQRSSQKLAALDLRPKAKPEAESGHWDGLQKHMERRKRLGLINRMRAAWDRPHQEKHER